MHEVNVEVFGRLDKEFFESVFKNDSYSIYLEDFRKVLGWRFKRIFEVEFENSIKLENISLGWDESDKMVQVYLATDKLIPDHYLALMHGHTQLRDLTAKALKTVYRYEGQFAFVEDIPF